MVRGEGRGLRVGRTVLARGLAGETDRGVLRGVPGGGPVAALLVGLGRAGVLAGAAVEEAGAVPAGLVQGAALERRPGQGAVQQGGLVRSAGCRTRGGGGGGGGVGWGRGGGGNGRPTPTTPPAPSRICGRTNPSRSPKPSRPSRPASPSRSPPRTPSPKSSRPSSPKSSRPSSPKCSRSSPPKFSRSRGGRGEPTAGVRSERSVWPCRGRTLVAPGSPGVGGVSGARVVVALLRTAWSSCWAPGPERPVQTRGRRRPGVPAAAWGVTALYALNWCARRGDLVFGTLVSCTRKLAWLTTTCAGSQGTLAMLKAGASSNPEERPPVEERAVLVSTLI
ncbi:Phosphoribosylformylglycinamidine cyclo-ligase [Streptomyces albus]|nr:Phosphoribosylformylglycinamidine cyclo-ligase [Streptomyces albus]